MDPLGIRLRSTGARRRPEVFLAGVTVLAARGWSEPLGCQPLARSSGGGGPDRLRRPNGPEQSLTLPTSSPMCGPLTSVPRREVLPLLGRGAGEAGEDEPGVRDGELLDVEVAGAGAAEVVLVEQGQNDG